MDPRIFRKRLIFNPRKRTLRMRLFNGILARQYTTRENETEISEKWFWQDVFFQGVEEFSGKMFYEQPSKVFYALSEVVSENEGLVNMRIYFRSNKEFLKRMSCLKISFRSINISLRSGCSLEENEVNLVLDSLLPEKLRKRLAE